MILTLCLTLFFYKTNTEMVHISTLPLKEQERLLLKNLFNVSVSKLLGMEREMDRLSELSNAMEERHSKQSHFIQHIRTMYRKL